MFVPFQGSLPSAYLEETEGLIGLPKVLTVRSSDIAQTPRERVDAPPLKAPRVEATDADAYEEGEDDNDNEEESDIDDILDMLGGDKEKDSVSTTRPPQSFLVMPRVTVALESLLPHIQHASKLGAPWLASSLALCLCHDVLAAVSYLTDSGYYLKWLSLDQFFINSEGRLQLCGLQGAVAVREESETMLALRSVEKTTPVKPAVEAAAGVLVIGALVIVTVKKSAYHLVVINLGTGKEER